MARRNVHEIGPLVVLLDVLRRAVALTELLAHEYLSRGYLLTAVVAGGDVGVGVSIPPGDWSPLVLPKALERRPAARSHAQSLIVAKQAREM